MRPTRRTPFFVLNEEAIRPIGEPSTMIEDMTFGSKYDVNIEIYRPLLIASILYVLYLC